MNIKDILSDKTIKAKDKVESLSLLLSQKEIKLTELITVAGSAKDADKGTCLEALEFASRIDPRIIDKPAFDFAVICLNEKAPRVKWESAKVIGNTAWLFPSALDEAIAGLLKNTAHTGAVVRWAAAFALAEIIKLKTKHNKELILLLKEVVLREEKNSIKKIYLEALKRSE